MNVCERNNDCNEAAFMDADMSSCDVDVTDVAWDMNALLSTASVSLNVSSDDIRCDLPTDTGRFACTLCTPLRELGRDPPPLCARSNSVDVVYCGSTTGSRVGPMPGVLSSLNACI